MRVRILTALSVVVFLLVQGYPASATGDLQTIVSFDASKGELPEGLAIDKHGNIFVSLVAPVSEIRKITPEGDESVVAHLPTAGLGPLGIALDHVGNVYVGVTTFDPATQGVYRIGEDGDAVRLPGTESIAFPNGLAFDDRGNLFVTDSIGGAVWRIPPGDAGQLWIQDPSLEGTGVLGTGFPIGANGIVYTGHGVIVGNTELGTLVRIPIRNDGSAGEPQVIADDPALFGTDGVALDVHGTVYVAVIAQSTIVRVSEDGIVETLADQAGGLNQASSITFGTGRGDRKALYTVNFGVFSSAPTPSVLRMPVDVPGAPLP